MTDKYIVKEVSRLDEVIEAYAFIRSYFPPRQVLEVGWFIDCWQAGVLRVVTVSNTEGLLVSTGGLFHWKEDNLCDIYQLCYQAVLPRYRGQGIGSAIFHHLLNLAAEQNPDAPVLALMTHPEDSHEDTSFAQEELYGDAAARYRFYTETKHGFPVGGPDARVELPELHRGIGSPTGQIAVSVGEVPLSEQALDTLLKVAFKRLEGRTD